MRTVSGVRGVRGGGERKAYSRNDRLMVQLDSRVEGALHLVGGIQKGFLEAVAHQVRQTEGSTAAGRREGEGCHRH